MFYLGGTNLGQQEYRKRKVREESTGISFKERCNVGGHSTDLGSSVCIRNCAHRQKEERNWFFPTYWFLLVQVCPLGSWLLCASELYDPVSSMASIMPDLFPGGQVFYPILKMGGGDKSSKCVTGEAKSTVAAKGSASRCLAPGGGTCHGQIGMESASHWGKASEWEALGSDVGRV